MSKKSTRPNLSLPKKPKGWVLTQPYNYTIQN
jgi:hypothetical protein